MNQELVLEAMRASRVVAIIRASDPKSAIDVGHAIISGGLPVVEVSLNTPGALDAISTLADDSTGLIGAGTVLEVADVQRVVDAGAHFMVTPNFNPEVVQAGLAAGLLVGPGVFTATECHQAMSIGAQVLKLFPAAIAGIPAMKALRDPFPTAVWLPTGGIGVSDIPAWLDAGALAVGMGSALTGGGPHQAEQKAQQISEMVRERFLPETKEGR